MFGTDDNRSFDVVCNDEGQYSLWPAGRAVPAGWTCVGMTATRSECLAYISRVWTDMRPRSLRRAIGA